MSQLQFVHIYRYTYDTCTLKMQVLSCNANVRNACSVSACYEKDKLFCFQLKVELLFFTFFFETKSKLNYSWLESTSQITLTLEPLIMVEISEPVKYLVHSPTSMSHPWSEGWSMVCLGFLTGRTVSSKSDLESCLGAYDCVESLLNQLYYFFILFQCWSYALTLFSHVNFMICKYSSYQFHG